MLKPTNTEIGEVVRFLVSEGSNLDYNENVIPANDDKGPAPKGPYATVLRYHSPEEGVPERRYERLDENDGDYNLYVNTITTNRIGSRWSVQFFNPYPDKDPLDVHDRSEMFRLWCASPEGVVTIARQNVHIVDVTTVMDSAAARSEFFEQRAILEFRASYNQTYTGRARIVDAVLIGAPDDAGDMFGTFQDLEYGLGLDPA